jgi:hypothetical protein
MINSLSNTSNIYQFIKNNYNLPISIVSKIKEGKILSNYQFNLPLDIKNIKKLLPISNLSEAGIYMFNHKKGKFALGSAMKFERRLIDHINSFKGHRTMQKLHKFAKVNGGLSSFT